MLRWMDVDHSAPSSMRLTLGAGDDTRTLWEQPAGDGVIISTGIDISIPPDKLDRTLSQGPWTSTVEDGYGNVMVALPLRLSSATPGAVNISAPDTIYSYRPRVEIRPGGSLMDEINEHLEKAADGLSPDALVRAVEASSFVVVARHDGELIGLARGLSDDVSVFYLQDLLVRPDWQRRGVGKALLLECLERFGHVRSKVLLTDDEERQRRFYEAVGYRDSGSLGLRAFVDPSGSGG